MSKESNPQTTIVVKTNQGMADFLLLNLGSLNFGGITAMQYLHEFLRGDKDNGRNCGVGQRKCRKVRNIS